MKSIDEHIQKDQSEIEAARASGDEAKVRHLTSELHSLEEYKEHNPEDKHDPTSLELYCDANPDADECRVYDDCALSGFFVMSLSPKAGFFMPIRSCSQP